MKGIRKKLIGWSVVLGILMSVQTISACMPHSPNDVFISRIHSVKSDKTSTQFQFSKHNFTFRPLMTWFKYSNPNQWKGDFRLQNIRKNDLVIGLAYSPDGAKPKDYQISSLALLHCNNGILSISKSLVPFLSWDREKGRCSYGKANILNGFLTHDQAYYLGKLQVQYPTCNKLYSAFPLN
mgnify:CR=1 FL=1